MANLGNGGFDANAVEPVDFTPLPAGKYLAAITESEMKPTKAGDGQYLLLTFQVVEGQYKGRKLFERLNLQNQNAQAVAIARGQLSAICRAIGVMTPKDSQELHSLPLMLDVKLSKRDDNGEFQNEIKGFHKREAASTLPIAATGAASAPWKRG